MASCVTIRDRQYVLPEIIRKYLSLPEGITNQAVCLLTRDRETVCLVLKDKNVSVYHR